MMDFLKRKKNKAPTAEIKGEEEGKSEITTDPLGMWTGVPTDPFDTPVQDADDL